MKIQKNISLKNHTTFRIGGRAKYFCLAKNKKDLMGAVDFAEKKKLPLFILGNGSNVLFDDKGFSGLVVKLQNKNIELSKNRLIVTSGIFLNDLVLLTVKKSLTGIEWMVGIPGTVGGAVFGNAGAFGKSMKNAVQTVEILNLKTKKFNILKNKECKFSYRESVFKHKKHFVIVSVVFQLKKGKKKDISSRVKEYLSFKKERQPLNLFSAGSVFKNSVGFSSAELIEEAGLKGKIMGGAKVSDLHANFIVNFNNAKAKDVKKLINFIKKKVKNKFNINLEEEIIIL